MKLAMIVPPFIQVPPKGYGGTERRVESLSRALLKKGVDLSLYCSGDSKTDVPKRSICDISLFNDKTYNHSTDRAYRINQINDQIIDLLKKESFDIIHCHDYDNPDLALKLSELKIPTLITIRHHKTPLIEETYSLTKDKKNIFFNGLSKNQVKDINPRLSYIYNGENPDNYSSLESILEKRAYFLSIGDTLAKKGIKSAVELSKKINLDLVIAGEPIYDESKRYFNKNVKPFIDIDVSSKKDDFIKKVLHNNFDFGNGNIIYFGLADDSQKIELYKHARFMQFLGNLEVSGNKDACPGILIESILCGTPALGISGNISDELIENGQTGLNVKSLEEAVSATKLIEKMHPLTVRENGIKKFSIDNVANQFIKSYNEILEECKK